MRVQRVMPKKVTLNNLIRRLGRGMMCLYIVMSFITASDYFPAVLNSIALYAFVLLGLVNFVLNKRMVLDNGYVLWYGIFCVFSFLWVPISLVYWPENEWTNTLYQMGVMLLLALAFSQFLEAKEDIRILALSYVLGALALFIFLAIAGQLYVDERLGTTVMGNANTFACSFMVAIILGMWVAVYSEKKAEKVLAWAAIAVLFYALLLSGGRKFILIPFLTLYIMLLLRRNKRGRRHVFFYTVLVAALFVGLFWLITTNDELYKIVGYRMEYLMNMVTGEGEIGSSNAIRLKMIELAFERGLESPLWGHGFDAFKNLGRQELNLFAYAHNNWAEIWYNCGLIGMLLYYGLYVKLLSVLWRQKESEPECTQFGLACIISIFVFEYGAVTYYLYPIQILLCGVVCMSQICLREKEVRYG